MTTVYTHLGAMTFAELRDAQAFFASMLDVAAEDNGWVAWAGMFYDADRRIL